MGEQMLSREYYYLGTQLPIDRFLTINYGHHFVGEDLCCDALVYLRTFIRALGC
jgi:hypothetical protein